MILHKDTVIFQVVFPMYAVFRDDTQFSVGYCNHAVSWMILRRIKCVQNHLSCLGKQNATNARTYEHDLVQLQRRDYCMTETPPLSIQTFVTLPNLFSNYYFRLTIFCLQIFHYTFLATSTICRYFSYLKQ